MRRRTFLARDTAIDLGTANTLVHIRKRGLVLNEPSIVALNRSDGKIVAAGTSAKLMVGRAPRDIVTVRPLKNGVIVDLDVAQRMLRHFLQAAHGGRYLAKPRIVVTVPVGITPVERRAVTEAAFGAGGRRVDVIEQPVAAACGSGLRISDPDGAMVVDVGGGTTDAAIMALGGVVVSHSVRVGGDNLDRALVGYLRRKRGLLLGEQTAEEIKKAIGTAGVSESESGQISSETRGRDLLTGLPRTVKISAGEVYEAIADPLGTMTDAIKSTFDQCPPELAVDLMETGITLSGGGALLTGLAPALQAATGMPVHLVDDPLTCVARGAALYMDGLSDANGRDRRELRQLRGTAVADVTVRA
jgi:rod shape-determining protein MreB and related proteins